MNERDTGKKIAIKEKSGPVFDIFVIFVYRNGCHSKSKRLCARVVGVARAPIAMRCLIFRFMYSGLFFCPLSVSLSLHRHFLLHIFFSLTLTTNNVAPFIIWCMRVFVRSFVFFFRHSIVGLCRTKSFNLNSLCSQFFLLFPHRY